MLSTLKVNLRDLSDTQVRNIARICQSNGCLEGFAFFQKELKKRMQVRRKLRANVDPNRVAAEL